MKVHATMTIRVVIDQAKDEQEVYHQLKQAANTMANRGELIRNDTDMVVDSWYSIVETREEK